MRVRSLVLLLAPLLSFAVDDVCDGYGDLRVPTTASSPDAGAVGARAADNLGTSVAVLPDFDGDGAVDLAVGVPGDSTGGPRAGAVRLFLSAGGTATLSATPDVVIVGSGAYDNAGASVASAGDLNGDGLTDLIIGAAPGARAAHPRGAAWIVAGSMSAPTLLQLSASTALITGAVVGDDLGAAVSGAGDLNDDGYDDVVVGAPGADLGGADSGAALVFFGPLSGLRTAASADRVWAGEAAGDAAGTAVAALGDVDGDGAVEVGVGAPGWGPTLATDGAVYVAGGGLGTGSLSSAGLRVRGTGGERLGFSLSSAGDVDHDGTPDLWAGARGFGSTKRGAAFLFTGLLPVGERTGRTSFDARVQGVGSRDFFGAAVSGGADFDADGEPDVVVGAEGADGVALDGGAAWVLHGPFVGNLTASSSAGRIGGAATGGRTGAAVAAVPDLDGDGFDDVLVGTPAGDPPGKVDAGFVGLFHGGHDVADLSTWYADADQDGWGGSSALSACVQPAGTVAVGGDCNDASVAFHPFAPETNCSDPNDYSCDGHVGLVDGDGDGVNACANDCDDANPAVGAGMPEYCANGVDDDCNGAVDDGLAVDALVYRPDSDGDGFGSAAFGVPACSVPALFLTPPVTVGGDCADSDATVFPGQSERCNGVDDNCDGDIDSVGAIDGVDYYADADEDGYGSLIGRVTACSAPSGYATSFTDCDDADADVSPDGEELCNYLDDDCDGAWYRGHVVAVEQWSVGHVAPRDLLGASIAALPDQDADGDDELALGAPGIGAVVIARADLRTGGYDLAVDLGAGLRGWRARLLAPVTGAGFGAAIAAGDFDGDGVGDLAVGAAGEAVGGLGTGAVHLYFGPFLGDRTTPDATVRGAVPGGGAGGALAAADVDGDGVTDLVIGAPGASRASWVTGRSRGAWSAVDLASAPTLVGPAASQTGSSLAVIGDTNGDGRLELAVGAPLAGSGSEGQVYVVTSASMAASSTLTGSSIGQRLGSAVAGGDLDGDGDADLAVAHALGRAYVVLSAGGIPSGVVTTVAASDVGSAAPQSLAASLAVADVNGDGVDDLLLGAPGNDDGARNAGAVYTVYGGTWRPTVDVLQLESAGRLPVGGAFPTTSTANTGKPEGFVLLGREAGAALGTTLLAGFASGVSPQGDVIGGAPGGVTTSVAGVSTGGYGLDLDAGGTWWTDADHDGWGDVADPQDGCAMHIPQVLVGAGAPYALGVDDILLAADCDDADEDINPGVTDAGGDGVDADCSGRDGAGSPAVVTSCVIAPTTPRPSDDLVVSAAAIDPDGGVPSISYAWSRNGVAVPSVTGATFPASLTERDDVVSVTCTPDDGAGDGVGMSASATVFNTQPTVLTVVITPGSPTVGSALTCAAVGADVDGDVLSASYAWSVDGVAAGTGATLAAPAKGASVVCAATVSDGYEDSAASTATVTVQDAAPTVSSCTLGPASPVTATTLTASAAGSDPDGDAISWAYGWRKDGLPQVAYTGATLDPAATTRGDSWSVDCVATSAGVSASATSAPLTIGNTAPVASVGLTPGTAYTNDTLVASITASDADGDMLSTAWSWTVNGGLTGVISNLLPGSWFSKGETVEATAAVSDGFTTSVATWSTSIADTAPSAPTVAFISSTPDPSTDPLRCAASASDVDGDTVGYEASWTVNGAAYGGATSTVFAGDTVPAGAYGADETWVCSVTATAGGLTAANTASLTVPAACSNAPYLSSHQYLTCAINEAAGVDCWGNTYVGPAPSGAYAMVSAGFGHACALDTSGGLHCWQYWHLNPKVSGTPTSGTWIAVSAGYQHSCAIASSGAVSCWGENYEGQSNAPSGTFTALGTGAFHSCALNTAGAVVCWGDNWSGRSTAPSGTFVSIAVGGDHSCAVDASGHATCWGWNQDGQLNVPAGTYISVSPGGVHTCGLKTDGQIVCWGGNSQGESSPPSGTFVAVAAGLGQTCGTRSSGSVECWGSAARLPPAGLTAEVCP